MNAATITAIAGLIGAVTALITAVRGSRKAGTAVKLGMSAHERLTQAGIPPAAPPARQVSSPPQAHH